jgi:selenocysteine-specific elongation factor
MPVDKPDGADPLEPIAIRILQEAKRHPVPFKRLQKDIARAVETCRTPRILATLATLVESGRVLGFGEGANSEYFWAENLEQLKRRLCTLLRLHHAKYPYDPGMSAGEIRRNFSETQTLNARRNIDVRLFELTLSACKREGLVVEADCGVRLSEFTPRPKTDEAYRRLEEGVLSHVSEDLCAHFDFEALSRQLGVDSRQAKAIVSGLLKAEKLLEIEKGCFVAPSVMESAKSILAAGLADGAQLRTGDVTILLGGSRRTTIPVLEYFDRIGFTRREGDFRELAQPQAGAHPAT